MTTQPSLRWHAGARRIVSSRTHAAIAGSLWGTPTRLLPGSHHKNRSLWEPVLQDGGVVCRGPLEPLSCFRRTKSRIRDSLLRHSRRSDRLNRLTMRCLGVPV